MSNSYFKFKQFTIHHEKSAMKVTTDACLFGAWCAEGSREPGVGSKVLDIGTGTGLLALMYAQKNSSARIEAIEIDKDAFEEAASNVNDSGFKDNVQVLQGDVRNFQPEKKYDCIISNPPFYENELTSDDKKKNVAHHNAGLLLDDLLDIIKNNLSPEGVFYLLLPYKRSKEIIRLLNDHQLGIQKIVFVKHSPASAFTRIMLMGAHKEGEAIIEELSIMDEGEKYSEEFVKLLKDYYLYL